MGRFALVVAGAAAVGALVVPPVRATTPVHVIVQSRFVPGDTRLPIADSGAPGELMRIANLDSLDHSLTSDTGEFDTGAIPAGGVASITLPLTSADYAYHCVKHPVMHGVITVK